MMNRRRFLGSSAGAAVAIALGGAGLRAASAQTTTALEARSADGARIALERDALENLRMSLRGSLLLPGEPGYEQARRVRNLGIDRHPALVVQPAGAADVATAVDFARGHALLVAVKCGGHSYSGKSTCEGGLQIDLSRMRGARMDVAGRSARVAGGSLLGDLDHESMAQGLVTTAGTVSHTGVGGLTLGGGFGRLARRYGLALDNLRSVDVVCADGQLRRASADEHPDLFWGVRGGGGNFGVVTSFEFGLHPMQRQVVGGDLVFPLSRARELLAFYAEYSQSAPDELYVDAIMRAPPGGKDGIFLLHACWSGDPARADAVLAPIAKLGAPLSGKLVPIDYVAIQRSWDQTDPRNEGDYLKSGFIDRFDAALVQALIDGFAADPGRTTTLFFQHSGGAIGRIAADATAFPHRRATHNMFINTTWPLEASGDPHIAYARAYWKTLEGYTNGYYTNEVANEPQRQLDENYQGNLARLRAVKTRYDPGNLFRLNANVLPA